MFRAVMSSSLPAKRMESRTGSASSLRLFCRRKIDCRGHDLRRGQLPRWTSAMCPTTGSPCAFPSKTSFFASVPGLASPEVQDVMVVRFVIQN